MKKLLTVFLTLTALLTLAVPARADVLFEPRNAFYGWHHDECTREERGYYANGEDGFVTVWNAPEGHRVEGQFENGTTLWVYWRYEDWGCISYWPAKGDPIEGWVPLADLQLVYDHISFAEEYADQITPYNGEFADYAGSAETANFFKYPGAVEIRNSFVLNGKSDILGNLTGTSDGESYIQSIFVDEDGRTWGYVNYMYGHLNAWFCLDQPDGESFPLRAVDQPELIPARTPVLPAMGYVPYLLVGAVVLGTAALLFLFIRKKKK